MRRIPLFALLLASLTAWGCSSRHEITGPDVGPADGLRASDLFHGRGDDDGHARSGFVYTMSNAASGNAIVAFARGRDGSLTPAGETPTGGLGSGDGLGSQTAVIVSGAHGMLFAVDAGSNDIATFRITGSGLRALGTTPSGGERPISLAMHDDLVFVLNAGGEGGVRGFRLRPNGRLAAIPGAARGLGAPAPGPAQVSFTPDGDQLIVTLKAANAIAVYDVREGGRLSEPTLVPSAGPTPFGFAFSRWNTLIVSEAAGGAANASSASSYRIGRHGGLSLITGPVPTHQSAACWVAVSPGGDYAYTTNAASNTISAYRVGADGGLSLLNDDGVAAHADGTPLDASFDASGRYLYVLNGSAHTLNAYRRAADGSLETLTGVGGLPSTSLGLAAY